MDYAPSELTGICKSWFLLKPMLSLLFSYNLLSLSLSRARMFHLRLFASNRSILLFLSHLYSCCLFAVNLDDSRLTWRTCVDVCILLYPPSFLHNSGAVVSDRTERNLQAQSKQHRNVLYGNHLKSKPNPFYHFSSIS